MGEYRLPEWSVSVILTLLMWSLSDVSGIIFLLKLSRHQWDYILTLCPSYFLLFYLIILANFDDPVLSLYFYFHLFCKSLKTVLIPSSSITDMIQ